MVVIREMGIELSTSNKMWQTSELIDKSCGLTLLHIFHKIVNYWIQLGEVQLVRFWNEQPLYKRGKERRWVKISMRIACSTESLRAPTM